MKSVRKILNQKNNHLIKLSPNATVFEALQLMMDHNISAVLIADENLEGIFTERDYARKVVLQGKSSKEVKLKEVMTANLVTISPQDSVEYCMQIMTDRHIRHLPVLEFENLVGMVSIGDVVKFVIEDQKQTIQDLESYIKS
ncbi:hypoxic response protein 1 [Pedobacter glucosidilyticus]|jgi:CBS domain-containing protein|uniref:CBS domain-containing protein n=1 Tax=Pedobacter aquae TaxID=2605747 RepID=A0A5C0VHF8_9SPHI|nr:MULTISPECIES: CBS domain-containing protein [Pedobacter]KHJ38186.1 hypoxic response protein 1 [Pedobacter glucosidilyticus]QEK52108.1 CBS domain-containing protein [Pedobacter aquae]